MFMVRISSYYSIHAEQSTLATVPTIALNTGNIVLPENSFGQSNIIKQMFVYVWLVASNPIPHPVRILWVNMVC